MSTQEIYQNVPLEALLLIQEGPLSPVEAVVLNQMILQDPQRLKELSEQSALTPWIREASAKIEQELPNLIETLKKELPQSQDTLQLMSTEAQARAAAMEILLNKYLPEPLPA